MICLMEVARVNAGVGATVGGATVTVGVGVLVGGAAVTVGVGVLVGGAAVAVGVGALVSGTAMGVGVEPHAEAITTSVISTIEMGNALIFPPPCGTSTGDVRSILALLFAFRWLDPSQLAPKLKHTRKNTYSSKRLSCDILG
jgi:hypothetical protein